MARIHIVGSSNTDLVIHLPRLPRPGETVTGGRAGRFQGGKGANQAVACARLAGPGLAVSFVGAVGDDAFGRAARAALAAEGIDLAHCLELPDQPSGQAFILVAPEGENMIAVAGGANHALRPDHVTAALAGAQAGDLLLVSLEVPLSCVRAALRAARERGLTTLLNPAPIPAGGLSEELLEMTDILTPNRLEAEQILAAPIERWPLPAKLGTAFARRHDLALVVTGGGAGASADLPGDGGTVARLLQPAFPAAAIDTVGAGDCFSAALAVACAEEHPWPQRLRFAARAAALCVTRRGAQASLPARAELEGDPGDPRAAQS